MTDDTTNPTTQITSDNVIEHVESHRDAINEHHTRLAGLDDQVAATATRLDENGQRLQTQAESLGAVDNRVNEHAGRLGTLETDRTAHADRLAQLTTSRGEHETWLRGVDTRLGGIGQRLDGHHGRLGQLETDSAGHGRHLASHDEQIRDQGQHLGLHDTRLDDNDRRVTRLGHQVEDEMERRGIQLGTYERALQDFQEEDREIERRERERARAAADRIRLREEQIRDRQNETEERRTDEDRRHKRVMDSSAEFTSTRIYDAPDGTGRTVDTIKTKDMDTYIKSTAASAVRKPVFYLPWWGMLLTGLAIFIAFIIGFLIIKGASSDDDKGKAQAVKVSAAEGNGADRAITLDDADKVLDWYDKRKPEGVDCKTPNCVPPCLQPPCVAPQPMTPPPGCKLSERMVERVSGRGYFTMTCTQGAEVTTRTVWDGEPGICPDCAPPPKKSGGRVILRVPVKGDKGDKGDNGRDGRDAPPAQNPPPAPNPPADNGGGEKAAWFVGLQNGVLYNGKPYRTAASLNQARQMIADHSTKATGLVCKVGDCRTESNWRRLEAFAN